MKAYSFCKWKKAESYFQKAVQNNKKNPMASIKTF